VGVFSAALTLVADIGGTHARFALAESDARIRCMTVVKCTDYERLDTALDAYLEALSSFDRSVIDRFCIAVAAPTETDMIKMTNHSWMFSRAELGAKFSVPVNVINDFSAQAWCLSSVRHGDIEWLQEGLAAGSSTGSAEFVELPSGTRTITGPGTGFGGASITPAFDVLSSEPGHVAFAPLNELQVAVLQYLWSRLPRFSVEHLISGPCLANIHSALAALAGRTPPGTVNAAQIVLDAEAGDGVALESLSMFSSIFGSVCGDMALSVGSNGGLFVSGDMLKKMGRLFDRNTFLDAFLDKGPFRQWCQNIPIAMYIAPDPGLRGCALYAARIRAGDRST